MAMMAQSPFGQASNWQQPPVHPPNWHQPLAQQSTWQQPLGQQFNWQQPKSLNHPSFNQSDYAQTGYAESFGGIQQGVPVQGTQPGLNTGVQSSVQSSVQSFELDRTSWTICRAIFWTLNDLFNRCHSTFRSRSRSYCWTSATNRTTFKLSLNVAAFRFSVF